MRNGSLRGRENATTALHQICCRGGELVANRLARMPGLVGVVHVVARLGTNRARRKALGLARMLQKAEPLVGLRGREWREEQVMGRSSEMASIPVAISVSVL
ncbi:hypothetical protein HPP92_004024 [Vanilla planifolia]|uniref:Uncharacterized protein n=1 Tax=Vanilla planifolia TaxID=51239 RepID=A0A835RYR2_VANPL|nr:hypothetical protein HPP92_004024 [Vanilla planifolia]